MQERRLIAIEHEHIKEKIYNVLLERILLQEFAPGERLQVDDIATALRVSRTPVKDALNRLAVEGLIVIVPRKGTFVADVTLRGIEEVFDVRLMLELHAGELAVPRATDGALDELAGLVASLGRFVNGESFKDYESFLELDNEFHTRLFLLADNSMLTKMYRDTNLRVQVVRAYQRAPGAAMDAAQTHREHEAVVAALRARDVAAVRAAINAHVTNRRKQIIAALGPLLDVTGQRDGGQAEAEV